MCIYIYMYVCMCVCKYTYTKMSFEANTKLAVLMVS